MGESLSKLGDLGIKFDGAEPWATRDASSEVRARLDPDLSHRIAFQVIANTLHLMLDGLSRATIDLKTGDAGFLEHDRPMVHELLALLKFSDAEEIFSAVYERFREEGHKQRVDHSMATTALAGVAAREVALVMGDLKGKSKGTPEIFPEDEVFTVKNLEKTRIGVDTLISELLEKRPSRVEVDSSDKEVNRCIMGIVGLPIEGTRAEYKLSEEFFEVADFYLRASFNIKGEGLPKFWPRDGIASLRAKDPSSKLSVSIGSEEVEVIAVSMFSDLKLLGLDEKNDRNLEVVHLDSQGSLRRMQRDGSTLFHRGTGPVAKQALPANIGVERDSKKSLLGKEGFPLKIDGHEEFKAVEVFDANCPLVGVAFEGQAPTEGLFYEDGGLRYFIVDLNKKELLKSPRGELARRPLAHSFKGDPRQNVLSLHTKVLPGEYCYEQRLYDSQSGEFLTVEGQATFSGAFGEMIVTDKGRLWKCKKEGAGHQTLYKLEGGNFGPTQFDAIESATHDDHPIYLVCEGGRWSFTQNLDQARFRNITVPGGGRINAFDEFRRLPMISNNPANCLHALRVGDKWMVVAGANDILEIEGQYLFDLPTVNEADRNFTVQTTKGPITVIWSYGFEYQAQSGMYKRS